MGKKLALISLGIGVATMVFLGFTLYQAVKSWIPLHQDTSKIAPYFLLLCGILVFNLGGIALGAVASTQKDGSRGLGLLGVGSNIFQSLVFLTFLGVWGISLLNQFPHVPRETHHLRSSSADPEASAPIAISPTTKILKTEHSLYLDQLNRIMLTGYEQAGSHDGKWDDQAKDLIRGTIARFGGEQDRPEADLANLGTQILGKECNDPLVFYCCGGLQKEIPAQKDLFSKAVAGFKTSHYSHLLGSWAASRLGRTLNPSSEATALEEADQTYLAFLKDALKDGSFTGSEWRFFIDEERNLPVFQRKGEEICKITENSSAEKWVAPTLWGFYYTNEAWKARGGGYANTVTDAGWQGFNDNLEKASIQFTSAWEMRKDEPVAAIGMITVAMGQGGSEARKNMRLWFDRATAAMFDNQDAYRSFLWAFRPRWFGSHSDMLAFGEQCLKTGRFDTTVPGVYFTAVQDVASELGDPNEVFKEPAVQQNLEKLFQGYLADPSCAKWQSCNRTQLALLYMKIGKIREAKAMLEANGNQLDHGPPDSGRRTPVWPPTNSAP